MIEKEFNLSEKIGTHTGTGYVVIHVEDIKEFIKRLKEELKRPLYGIPICSCNYYNKDQDPKCLNCKIINKIDKLAGDKLI